MKFNNRNVFVDPSVKIGVNVKIGDNSIIYPNVFIGDNTIICNDCIIGEPPSVYYKDMDNYINPPTYISANSMIRSHCIIYAGSEFGEGLITGHRATIREKSKFGINCLISTLADVQGNCEVGDYSRLYSNVHVGEKTKIGKYVFVFPYTVFTNDPLPPSDVLLGATVGDYSIITIHCNILPGVHIGSNCLVGANSVVSRDIEDFSFAIGSPAKRKMDIREIPSKKDSYTNYYPWPNNFERGMPWEKIGFEEWTKLNTQS
ncbi:acyltransferase [Frigoriflavimonas asaccharolytica]|uniref:Acetyltransferase-like isoleucine patch superfamily enzyme n=1 Tax=Frigoriflavimonas asaccharolytica TaxID=2735899 RepID=A0A8J8G823_9FLAO|nr:acyltransferase [Frigoriflavimonas asaccharolytica]NRS92676.1 acetyltransferase-like isoleucine patch superfamily enzyme [Frigoriflavimonas asaccharolytica]